MQLAFIIIFSFIFIITGLCIFKFRYYNQKYISTIDSKKLSIRFILGFCSLCTDLLYKLPFFKSSSTYTKTKGLVSSVYIDDTPEKNLYVHHLRLISYTVIITLIGSFLGLMYTVSLYNTNTDEIAQLTRPANGEGNQNISLITDSELYSGSIDLTIEDRKYTFDEVMKIFGEHRSAFDTHVLKNNISFLHVDSPLNFPTTWGDKNISISWFISATDIIDYSGSLISENITSEGVPLEIVATMTLDDISADICYQLIVFPPKLSDKERVETYLNKIINSNQQLTKDVVILPDNVLGFDISYSKDNKVYPTMDIYNYYFYSSYFSMFT